MTDRFCNSCSVLKISAISIVGWLGWVNILLASMYTVYNVHLSGLHAVLLVGHCSQLVKTASGIFITRMGHSCRALDVMLMIGF